MDDIATVVVGIDGSAGSRCALEFALQDARRRRARLRVVTAAPVPRRWGSAYGMGMSGTGAPPSTAETVGAVREAAQVMVDEVTADRPELVTEVPIDIVAAVGAPAEVLLSIARHADLLVLGHRGHGGFAGRLLGSVGLQCVLHAECPVTVVGPPAHVAVDPGAVHRPVRDDRPDRSGPSPVPVPATGAGGSGRCSPPPRPPSVPDPTSS